MLLLRHAGTCRKVLPSCWTVRAEAGRAQRCQQCCCCCCVAHPALLLLLLLLALLLQAHKSPGRLQRSGRMHACMPACLPALSHRVVLGAAGCEERGVLLQLLPADQQPHVCHADVGWRRRELPQRIQQRLAGRRGLGRRRQRRADQHKATHRQRKACARASMAWTLWLDMQVYRPAARAAAGPAGACMRTHARARRSRRQRLTRQQRLRRVGHAERDDMQPVPPVRAPLALHVDKRVATRRQLRRPLAARGDAAVAGEHTWRRRSRPGQADRQQRAQRQQRLAADRHRKAHCRTGRAASCCSTASMLLRVSIVWWKNEAQRLRLLLLAKSLARSPHSSGSGAVSV